MAEKKELTVAQKNIGTMKSLITSDSIKSRMGNLLGKEAGTFLTSVLDLYTSDTNLSNCNAVQTMTECMKAAALKLPVAKSLGFCYIIPYKNTPQFQLGYKGYIQLAQRSGQYKYLNADIIYEGENVKFNRLSGMIEISGEPTSDTPIGYFAYFQLMNGFEKCVYWTKEKVEAHAKRYSMAWRQESSPWHKEFDSMALKTVIKTLIAKYGVMSVEFAQAVSKDVDDMIEQDVTQNANGAPVSLPNHEPTAAPLQAEIMPETIDVAAEPDF